MKYEDAKNLKPEDEVLVRGVVNEVDGTDETETLQIVTNGGTLWVDNKDILVKMYDFEKTTSDEAQKLIVLTGGQASDFDAIMSKLTARSAMVEDIKDVLGYIKAYPIEYPFLNKYLFGNDTNDNLVNQINFVKLIENPELLTVKDDLYVLRVADGYLQYDFAWKLTTDIGYAKKFTDDELEKLKEDPNFASINIDKAKTKLAY